MNKEEMLDMLSRDSPETTLYPEYEDALIGIAEIQFNKIALYNKERCVEILEERGMSHDDAVEFFDVNVTNVYAGELTPGFVTLID